MEKNYKLKCSKCNEFYLPTETEMYQVKISKINYDPYVGETGKSYPHKIEHMRTIQLCKNCLNKSDLQIILKEQNRGL